MMKDPVITIVKSLASNSFGLVCIIEIVALINWSIQSLSFFQDEYSAKKSRIVWICFIGSLLLLAIAASFFLKISMYFLLNESAIMASLLSVAYYDYNYYFVPRFATIYTIPMLMIRAFYISNLMLEEVVLMGLAWYGCMKFLQIYSQRKKLDFGDGDVEVATTNGMLLGLQSTPVILYSCAMGGLFYFLMNKKNIPFAGLISVTSLPFFVWQIIN